MKKVLILQGIPGSGKTTLAKKLVNGGGWLRINKDELRDMMFNYQHSKGKENRVVNLRDWIISSTMLDGQYNIVVDDTNFNPVHIDTIKSIVDNFNKHILSGSLKPKEEYEVEVRLIDTPLKTAVERDRKRGEDGGRSVGPKVIKNMYRQRLALDSLPYAKPEDKPKAILVDIDGTLAHMIPKEQGGRSPYDYDRVSEDIVDEVIRDVVWKYQEAGYKIIIMSGREDDCRDVTEQWLASNGITYDHLYMRAAGDSRNDAIVKRELFDAHVRYDYRIEFVLDDRDRVVEMWRANGLKVLQVAEGDF